MRSAVGIINGEHQNLERVLLALGRYVPPLRAHEVKPDCEVFARILWYIEIFADRFHHPKEDKYLFRALRERTGQADSVLVTLQQEHASGPLELHDLKQALMRTRGGGVAEVEEFALLLECYVKGQRAHLRIEDKIVIPMAQGVLRNADWETIDQAFRANRDPLFGAGSNRSISGLVDLAFVPAPA